jgi:hypothetical protein
MQKHIQSIYLVSTCGGIKKSVPFVAPADDAAFFNWRLCVDDRSDWLQMSCVVFGSPAVGDLRRMLMPVVQSVAAQLWRSVVFFKEWRIYWLSGQ